MPENSFWMDFHKISIRDTLIPPPVLPAHAPMNMITIIVMLAKAGHRLKSAVAKPVDVIMDATWKKLCLKISLKDARLPAPFWALAR